MNGIALSLIKNMHMLRYNVHNCLNLIIVEKHTLARCSTFILCLFKRQSLFYPQVLHDLASFFSSKFRRLSFLSVGIGRYSKLILKQVQEAEFFCLRLLDDIVSLFPNLIPTPPTCPNTTCTM